MRVFSGAALSEGAVAAGSSANDASNRAIISYAVTVSGGDLAAFPGLTLQNATADGGGGSGAAANPFLRLKADLPPAWAGDAALDLFEPRVPVAGFTDTIADVALNLADPTQGECSDCAPSLPFDSGDLLAYSGYDSSGAPIIPEPGTLGLSATGAAALAFFVRRRIARTGK
jgi:hypothetical protein